MNTNKFKDRTMKVRTNNKEAQKDTREWMKKKVSSLMLTFAFLDYDALADS
jgi:hypothetical protein